MSERTCASPTPSAVSGGTSLTSSNFVRGDHRSISRMTMPPRISAQATTAVLKRCSLIQSWIRKPMAAAGTKEIARLRKNRRLAGSVLAEAAACSSRTR